MFSKHLVFAELNVQMFPDAGLSPCLQQILLINPNIFLPTQTENSNLEEMMVTFCEDQKVRDGNVSM